LKKGPLHPILLHATQKTRLGAGAMIIDRGPVLQYIEGIAKNRGVGGKKKKHLTLRDHG
jgi:hypothetical protein